MATKTTAIPEEIKTIDPNEEIAIHLFKDGGKYKGDVFVAVNGKRVQIKRGETVKVKQKYAEVIENSMKQDAATADLIEQKVNEFNSAARFYGI
jgi:hypothetical protein